MRMQDSSEGQGHHSPWELFTPGVDIGQAADEAPCLDAATTDKVAQKVTKLMRLPRFAAYITLPDPAEKWVAAGLGRAHKVAMLQHDSLSGMLHLCCEQEGLAVATQPIS